MKDKPIISLDLDNAGLYLLTELLNTCLEQNLYDEKSKMTNFIKDILTGIRKYRDQEKNASL